MGVELDYSRDDIVIENIHLGDSLMILNYEICRQMEEKKDRERELQMERELAPKASDGSDSLRGEQYGEDQ